MVDSGRAAREGGDKGARAVPKYRLKIPRAERREELIMNVAEAITFLVQFADLAVLARLTREIYEETYMKEGPYNSAQRMSSPIRDVEELTYLPGPGLKLHCCFLAEYTIGIVNSTTPTLTLSTP